MKPATVNPEALVPGHFLKTHLPLDLGCLRSSHGTVSFLSPAYDTQKPRWLPVSWEQLALMIDSSLRKQVGHDMSKRDHNPGEEGSCAVQTLRVRGYLESK